MKTKVLQAMKPKTASLGFSKEEIESVAAQIAGTLAEDATEEQINAQIDAVIPYLQLSQKAYTRVVNEQKKKDPKTPNVTEQVSTIVGTTNPEDDKVNKLTELIEKQGKLLETLIHKDITSSRLEIYSEKLKDLPKNIKESKIKDFNRMTFTDDADFTSYLEEQDAVIEGIIQEVSNEELSRVTPPNKSGKTQTKEASDKEITEVLDKLNIV